MKTLLLFFIFNISDGNMSLEKQIVIPYSSKAECNQAGNVVRDSLEWTNPNWKSFSVCISESDFKAQY